MSACSCIDCTNRRAPRGPPIVRHDPMSAAVPAVVGGAVAAPPRLATFEFPRWQHAIGLATGMQDNIKGFARELFAYIHVFHAWQPTTGWSIGPGLEVGVFGAISWVLLLFYKAVEDDTLLLTHLYREFKHMLDAKRRAAAVSAAPAAPAGDKAAPVPEPEWTLDERLMLHAALLIETFKPEVRAAKFKPQPLKILKATCPAPLDHPPIIRDRADTKNIYGIIADHCGYTMTARSTWSYYEVMEMLTRRTVLSEAKELGKEGELSRTFSDLVVLAAHKLLNVCGDDEWLRIKIENKAMISRETPQQKIAAFVAKMLSNNRAAATAEAWRP